MTKPALLRPATVDEAVTIFCDAFAEYPVMRYVLGPSTDYAERLRDLITFFVMGRVLRDDPMVALEREGQAVACATLVRPGSKAITRPGAATQAAELDTVAAKTWERLGGDARCRYRAYADAANAVDVDRPNFHVSMIGVASPHLGQGLARPLLEDAHARSTAHPESEGVSLTTEFPANVSLYQHFGYEIVGHVRLNEALETWGLFRPDRMQA